MNEEIIQNEEVFNETVTDSSTVSYDTSVLVTQEDFYAFNNNFVTTISFLSLALGILCGVILGHLFNGIFND